MSSPSASASAAALLQRARGRARARARRASVKARASAPSRRTGAAPTRAPTTPAASLRIGPDLPVSTQSAWRPS
eukprot:8745470-Alexandrium_andersonii.AAC.1